MLFWDEIVWFDLTSRPEKKKKKLLALFSLLSNHYIILLPCQVGRSREQFEWLRVEPFFGLRLAGCLLQSASSCCICKVRGVQG